MVVVIALLIFLFTGLALRLVHRSQELVLARQAAHLAAAAAAGGDIELGHLIQMRKDSIPTMTFAEAMRIDRPERPPPEAQQQSLPGSNSDGEAPEPCMAQEPGEAAAQPLPAQEGALRAARTCSGGGTCSVCLAEFEEADVVKRLPCSHIFHAECLDEWLSRDHVSCPYCRRDLAASTTHAAEGDNSAAAITVLEPQIGDAPFYYAHAVPSLRLPDNASSSGAQPLPRPTSSPQSLHITAPERSRS
jgi:hypothetical protein